MAAELQPPETQITTATTTAPPPPPPPPNTPPPPIFPEQPHHTAALPQQLPPPKRQRRPSVRLGEIGEQPYDLHVRRTKPPIRNSRDWSKSVKARSITNLVDGKENVELEEVKAQNGEVNVELGRRKKGGRGTRKRMRWSWMAEESGGGDSGGEGIRNDGWEWESEMKEKSPEENERRWGDDDEVENWESKNEGVRTWLIELGLSRYAPVFEVHEVDDQVLPFLTLEDLKDMGINAVGSRRKIFSAIQKLRRPFLIFVGLISVICFFFCNYY